MPQTSFVLIYIDLYGLIIKSLERSQYFVITIDVFFRNIQVYFLKIKN